MGLEFLQSLGGVVDESKSRGHATTIACAKTEDGNLVLGGFVDGRELLTEIILGEIGKVWVQNVTVVVISELAKDPICMQNAPRTLKICNPHFHLFNSIVVVSVLVLQS